MDLIAEIRRAFKERPEKTKGGLAAKLGKHQNVVTYILNGTREIKAREVPIIRKYLELENTVPIVGSVGAGSEAHFYQLANDAPGESIPAPEGASLDTVAVEIRGDSLGPAFDGWLAFYDDRKDGITSDLHGRLCIVGLDTGQVLIKLPRPARLKGRFHLFSNGLGEPILDAKVEWAARIIDMKPKP